jgi:hypothetical protein
MKKIRCNNIVEASFEENDKEKAQFIFLMEIYILDNLKMVKCMGKVNINIQISRLSMDTL